MSVIVAEAPVRAKKSKKATPAAPAISSQQRAAAAGEQIQTGLQILAGAIASMDTEGSARTIAQHAQQLIQALPLELLANEPTQDGAEAVYDGLHLPLALIMGAIGADHESTSALDSAWRVLDAAQNELDLIHMKELPEKGAVAEPLVAHWSDSARSFVHRLATVLFNAEQSGEFEGRPAQETLDVASCALYSIAAAPASDLLWSGSDSSHAITMLRAVQGLLDLALIQGEAAGDLNDVQSAVVPMVQTSLQALNDALMLVVSSEAPPALAELEMQALPQLPTRMAMASTKAPIKAPSPIRDAVRYLENAQDIACMLDDGQPGTALLSACVAMMSYATLTGEAAERTGTVDDAQAFSLLLEHCIAMLDAVNKDKRRDAIFGVRLIVWTAKEQVDSAVDQLRLTEGAAA